MDVSQNKTYTLKDTIESSIRLDLRKLSHYRKMLRGMKIEGRLKCRRNADRRGSRYYYVAPLDGKEVYLGRNKRRTIKALQKKRFAEEMIRILTNNIKAKEIFCESYIDDSVETVIKSMPRAYRPIEDAGAAGNAAFPQSENPYNRENLKIKTSFGLYVRSKGELQIAELLYSLGIEFYYEKALPLWNGTDSFGSRTFFPDFTIPLGDGRVLYWEHKGMMSDEQYVKRDIEKEIIYNLNGIYQPHNLIVTAEGPDNEFDMEAVVRIVGGVIVPMMAA